MKEAGRGGIFEILNRVGVPFEKVRERPSSPAKSGPRLADRIAGVDPKKDAVEFDRCSLLVKDRGYRQ